MTSSVFTDPSPQYRTATGDVCAGGTLKFFASGTLNAQDVYSDSALTTNIGAVISLGSDGRATGGSGTITVYLDDALQYRAQLYDANGALQWDTDPVNPQATGGSTIPALVAGDFLSNDGSQLLWDVIRQLPDPTGHANQILSTDGTNFTFIAKPADGANAAVTLGSGSLRIGGTGGDDFLIQWGTGTAPASGTHTTTVNITYPTTFKTFVHVGVSVTQQNFSQSDYLAATATIFRSVSGFSFLANTLSGSATAGNITSDVPFSWIAFGTIAP